MTDDQIRYVREVFGDENVELNKCVLGIWSLAATSSKFSSLRSAFANAQNFRISFGITHDRA